MGNFKNYVSYVLSGNVERSQDQSNNNYKTDNKSYDI